MTTSAAPGAEPGRRALGALALVAVGTGWWRARARAAESARRLAGTAATGERLRRVTESAPVGLFALDRRGDATYANPALRALLGAVHDRPLTDPSRLAPEDRDRVVESWRRSRTTGGTHAGHYRVLGADGTTRWVKELTTPLPDGAGWVGTVTDVQDEVSALEESRRLSAVLAASPDWVVLADAEGRYLWVNDAARRHWGVPDGADLGDHHPLQLLRSRSRHVFLRHAVPTAAATGTWRGELTVIGPDGGDLLVSLVLVAHRSEGGAVSHFSCVVRDLSEREAYEARLTHRGLHSELTGLPNRALVIDRLAQALARAQREQSRLGVLLIDVDDFGAVNHSYGHESGDALLVLAAARLSSAVRAGDTVGHLGADQFVVICDDVGSAADAEQVADTFSEILMAPYELVPYELGEQHVRVSVSVGIALGDGEHVTPHVLLADAGTALQRAKQRGRARREVFVEELRRDVARRLRTAGDLHRALAHGEFRLVFQPEVCLRNGRYVAAEALIRWQHPQRGLVTPGEFVPLAEETGLVVGMGAWVLDTAAAQAARWRAARYDGAPLPVWVNLSARQLADPALVATVEAALTRHDVAPDQLGLEITETAVLEDAAVALLTLRQLKALGLRLAVDDFGTGYSSLSQIKELPIDLVKIDRSFVDGLGRDPDDTAIVGAVLGMSRALGLMTVAEGVETPAQAGALIDLDCLLAQGYHFLPPRPAPLVTAVLAQQRAEHTDGEGGAGPGGRA